VARISNFIASLILHRQFMDDFGIMSLTDFLEGRDAALRRPGPAGRNERGKLSVIPSPDAALGDGDSAARLSLPG